MMSGLPGKEYEQTFYYGRFQNLIDVFFKTMMARAI